jgi:superfamily II DNA/RNA helicase
MSLFISLTRSLLVRRAVGWLPTVVTIRQSLIHGRSTRCTSAYSSTTSSSSIIHKRFSSRSSDHIEHDNNNTDHPTIFADSSVSFESIGVSSPLLLNRLQALGHIRRPTSVQAAAFPVIRSHVDVAIGAETGSGKTLAYLLPIMNEILWSKQQDGKNNKLPTYDYARALILVPNKELVQQVARMAQSLASDSDSNDSDVSTTVRLAILPGGLNDPLDFRPFRDSIGLGGTQPPVDILISTPASVGPLALKPKHVSLFADIETLVIDEADMLLDGGYLRQLENVLMGFRRADRLVAASASAKDDFGDNDPDDERMDLLKVHKTQHIFVAATLPDKGRRSVDAYLSSRFPYATRVTMKGMHSARHYGLKEKTVWYPVEGKKERLQQLVDLMNMSANEGGLQGEKVMVFLNSVEDVDNVNEALMRAGVDSLAYHAKMKLDERGEALDRFRRYTTSADAASNDDSVGVLVCTDLASRGLDVPGVDVVVQLQFAGNVVSHLHRMGRCGRAGQRTGRGIVFYSEQESPLVKVVQMAENEQESMVLEQDVDFEEDDPEAFGTVQKAFSRKRGFTKKIKKLRREADEVAHQ